MYFDAGMRIPKHGSFALPADAAFAWVSDLSDSTLKELDLDDNNPARVAGVRTARDFAARLEAMREGPGRR